MAQRGVMIKKTTAQKVSKVPKGADSSGFLKFLGTAGARFVMMKQLRSSAGIWLRHNGTNIVIDPGPGSIVRCNAARPKLDPTALDAIVLTHKHLDHSGDVNVMIEAMTEGGFKKRGTLFAPADAFGPDGVIFSYCMGFPERITRLEPGEFKVGGLAFKVPVRNKHSVATYGLTFNIGSTALSIVSDTKYSEELTTAYKGSDILVLNVVFFEQRPQYEHLSFPEALAFIKAVRPKRAILTHFGMSMLKAKPRLLEEGCRKELGMDIVFAYDGMTVEL